VCIERTFLPRIESCSASILQSFLRVRQSVHDDGISRGQGTQRIGFADSFSVCKPAKIAEQGWRLRLAAATFVASLVLIGCGVAATAQPVVIELGRNFSLRTGESAATREAALRVGFDGVTADSRCPKGEKCIWAGDATTRVWIQQGSGPRETRDLHAALGAVQAMSVPGYELRLVRLDPYPVSGKPIESRDYTATLMLSRNSAVESKGKQDPTSSARPPSDFASNSIDRRNVKQLAASVLL